MTGEARFEDRVAPIVVIGRRRSARHLPACQRRIRFNLGAVAQEKNGDATFAGRESQAAAGHQIQAFGHALYFQQQRADMRAGQNIAGRRQGIGGVAGLDQDQLPRIAAQFREPIGRHRAIFHRFVVGPDPEEGAPFSIERVPRSQHRQQDGKTTGIPSVREYFVQGARSQTPAQHAIRLWMTQWYRSPVGWQAITRQRMAQLRQLCAFVHDMFYNAPVGWRVNPARTFVRAFIGRVSGMLRRNWWRVHMPGNSKKRAFPWLSVRGRGRRV